MRTSLLELLRCPYCGTPLTIVENSALVRDATWMESGVVGCACCAYPVVAGIPVLKADDISRAALRALEGDGRDALALLLGLSDRVDTTVLGSPKQTYRDALGVVCPTGDAEADYLFHRFSDPTFRIAEAVLTALDTEPDTRDGMVLDLCGGAGHLTRVLQAPPTPARGTLTADLWFWKLWLATQFVAPGCDAVCCDANHPLPVERHRCSMVVLADAFPYIWHKRLLADEMTRLVGKTGVVVMPHLHSALGENFSAGDTLTPSTYASLFERRHPRLYADTTLLTQLLDEQVVDLGRPVPSPAALGDEPSLTLVASKNDALFTRYPLPDPTTVRDTLIVNPLYRVTRDGRGSTLTLDFPTAEYAEEFADCRQYLPDTVTLPGDLTAKPSRSGITREQIGDDYEELRRRRVLLDVPSGYC